VDGRARWARELRARYVDGRARYVDGRDWIEE
jgi:hypothetical protein